MKTEMLKLLILDFPTLCQVCYNCTQTEVLIYNKGFGENMDAKEKNGLTTQCGSPAYAAPELLAKRVYGYKVDVWSWLVLLL